MILGHANVSDSDTHAENLLQLELDGGLDFVDLSREILVVRDWSWEFTSYGSSQLTVPTDMKRLNCAYPWRDQDPRDVESA